MRRKDREITDTQEIKAILSRAEVLRIALNNGDYPYILPVNFGFEMDGEKLTLFFHGAKEGMKHEIIKNDNRISFETDCSHKLIPPTGEEACTASFAYESVIGHGRVEMADEAEKERLLLVLLDHYGIHTNTFAPMQLKNTVVYKITAVGYTAKRRSMG